MKPHQVYVGQREFMKLLCVHVSRQFSSYCFLRPLAPGSNVSILSVEATLDESRKIQQFCGGFYEGHAAALSAALVNA